MDQLPHGVIERLDDQVRPGQQGNTTLAALSGVAVGVIIVLLIWLIFLNTDRKDGQGQVSTAPSPSAVSSKASATSATVTPSRAPASSPAAGATRKAIGDVRSLPAGLFCRDLKGKGYSYVAAVDYWRFHGQPNQMDADRNGIPCETVYPRSDVGDYWKERTVAGATGAPAGLLCRDLVARGASYAEAVAYWWFFDMPMRMDADGNGIPCETVYSAAAVNSFWFQ